jgi:hypothetical protein
MEPLRLRHGDGSRLPPFNIAQPRCSEGDIVRAVIGNRDFSARQSALSPPSARRHMFRTSGAPRAHSFPAYVEPLAAVLCRESFTLLLHCSHRLLRERQHRRSEDRRIVRWRRRTVVTEMTATHRVVRLTPEFDDFLFSPVGQESNGMALSVVSALARLGVDPWLEAAKLTRLPQGAAIQQLAGLLASLPDPLSGPINAGAIAARLIARLPRRSISAVASRARLRSDASLTSPLVLIWLVSCALLFAFTLSAQFTDRQSPSQIDSANATGTPPASAVDVPQVPALSLAH